MLLSLAQEAGIDPKHKASTHGGEYCAACPKCGGNDRFLIWPNKQNNKVEGSYWCRVCSINGDAIQFCRDFLGLEYADALKRCGIDETPSYFPKQSFDVPQEDVRANINWKEKLTTLSDIAKDSILKHPDTLEWLERRGIPRDAIATYGIGYLSTHITYERKDLGLPLGKNKDGKPKETLWIPRGITIPTFDGGKLIRMKVRRSDWHHNDELPKYWEISGGLKGLNLIGNTKKENIIVVESELDAYAVHWALQGKALVIAVGSNTKRPDSRTHGLVKASKRLIILCDNDEPGKAMGEMWQSLYAKARCISTPIGKDVGEAFEKGCDVKGLIEDVIKI